MQGVALVADPRIIEKETEDAHNNLVLVKMGQDLTVSHWAGFAWDKSGQCADEATWRTLVDQFAQGLQSPIKVSVAGE
jgi:hypothetical protein